MKKQKLDFLYGSYSSYEYVIEDQNGNDPLYRGGNSRWESTTVLPLKDLSQVESFETMKRFCNQTGEEMAKELGVPWMGCTFDETSEDEWSYNFKEPGRMSDGSVREEFSYDEINERRDEEDEMINEDNEEWNRLIS